jgi:hypothetical protein
VRRAPGRGDQGDAFTAREVEVKADGAKPQPAGVPAADRVLPVGLKVDATLHADTTAGTALRSHVFLLDRMGLRTLADWVGARSTAASKLTKVDQLATSSVAGLAKNTETSRFAGTLCMELGGLEPPTSWVRSRRSPN